MKRNSVGSLRAQSPAFAVSVHSASSNRPSSHSNTATTSELHLHGDSVAPEYRPRHRWIQKPSHAPRKKGATLSTRWDEHDMSNSQAVRQSMSQPDAKQTRPTPALDLSSLKQKTEMLVERNISHMDESGRIVRLGEKDDVQPYLGPQMKKNLAKQGMTMQKLSLDPDEWDDAEVHEMLGAHYSSKEAERKAKHRAWYERKMGKAYVAKLTTVTQKAFAVNNETLEKMGHGTANVSVLDLQGARSQQGQVPQEGVDSSVLSLSASHLFSSSDVDSGIASLTSLLTTKHDSSTLAGTPLRATKRQDQLRERTRYLTVRGAAGKKALGRNFLQPMTAAPRWDEQGRQAAPRVGSPTAVPSLSDSILPCSPLPASADPPLEPPRRPGGVSEPSAAALMVARRRFSSMGSGGDAPASSF